MTARAAALCTVAACALALVGCAGTPRAFLADRTVQITSPEPMTIVQAPFTVAWTATRGAASYAVFVDRTPIPPGHTMRDLATAQCKRQPGCPDATYLANLRVYLTSSDEVSVPSLPVVGGLVNHASHPSHTLTVVALDANGRRSGDAAWTVEFRA